jgi:type IV pilus assembly protein PilN
MKLSLNLASRSYVNQRALKRLYLLLGLLLLALLAVQLKVVVRGRAELSEVQNNLSQLRQQLQEMNAVPLSTEQIKLQNQQHLQARMLLERDAFRWSALFDRLEKQLPEGASILSFNPDYTEQSLVLIGIARNLGDLQQLLDNLHRDTYRQVFLRSQSRVEVSDGAGGKKTALNFSIKLEGVF